MQGSPASQPQQCGSMRAANTTRRGQRQRMPPGSQHHPCLKPHKSAPALVQLRAAAGRDAGGGNGSAPDAERNGSTKPAQTTRCAARGRCRSLALTSTRPSRIHLLPRPQNRLRNRHRLRFLPMQSASGRHASSGGGARGASSIGGAARGGLGQRQSRRRRRRRRYTPGRQRPRMRRSVRQICSLK